MQVVLKLFAIARQKVGQPSITLDLPDGSTVADLKRALAVSHPSLVPLLPNLLIAVANEYARDDLPISPGAEVAAIPPVSGGSS